MRVTVSVGPGHHSAQMIQVLTSQRVLERVFYSWPRAEIWCIQSNGTLAREMAFPAYDRLVRLTWALWRRIPYWQHYETPKAYLYSIFDRLVSPHVGQADIFIGWSQVSLASLRRAKQQHILALLDHPMVHVKTWRTLMEVEYKTYGVSKSYSKLTPRPMMRRMEMEYETADAILVPSTAAGQTFIENEIPASKIHILPLGIDTDLFQPDTTAQAKPFRVLYVGRLELLKGVHYLLQAFAELKLPNAELWLVGPLLPEIKPYLEMYREHFTYLGGKEHRELPPIYQQASVLILPSVHEGFGLVIIEAMASGIPAITTPLSAGPDIIQEGINGFVIPGRSVEALQEQILWLYEHQNRARELGHAARSRILENYTLAHYRQRLMDTLSAPEGDRNRTAL